MMMRARLLGAALAAGLLAISVWYVGRSHADDTFIFMRYASNLLNGGGVSFNPGEPTYGFTSSAWLAIATGAAALFGNTIAVWKFMSWCSYGAYASVLTGTWAQRPSMAALLATAAAALEPYLLRWSGSGMENAFAALMVLLTLLLWRKVIERRAPLVAMGLMLAALPLVRPELGILSAAIVAEWLWRASRDGRPREPIRAAIVGASVVVAVAIVMHAFTGAWLPQTAAAKAIATRQIEPGYGFRQATLLILSAGGPMLLLGVILMREPAHRPLLRPAFVLLGAFWLYLGWQNQLVSSRYTVTLVTPGLLAVCLALRSAAQRPRVTLPLLSVQLLVALVVSWNLFPGTRTDEGLDIRQFAERTRATTGPGDRVALTEIGAFAFYSGRYVIDLVGLTDPATVGWMREHGDPKTVYALENLLQFRRATHWVDISGRTIAPVGRQFSFVPLLTGEVRRNNVSGEQLQQWRLYRLDPLTATRDSR